MLPLVGAIHLAVNSFFKKSMISILAASLLIFFLAVIFKPFVTLLPNLGIDSFFEATNFEIKEAIFYIKTFGYSMYSVNSLILWGLICSIYLIFIWLLKIYFVKFGLKTQTIKKVITLIISSLIALPIFVAIYLSFVGYQQAISIESKVKDNFDSDLSQINIQSNNNIPLNLIMYIGESTSSLNWSLYGYPRPTTMSLDKHKGKGELIKFDNILSPHTHTSPSLLEVLSIDTDYTFELNNLVPIEKRKRTSLVDLLNEGGIKTHLYSNQGSSGTWNMASSIIFENAYVKKYSSNRNLGNAADLDKNKPYDHVLLDKFLYYLGGVSPTQKSLMVFHSYAGHGPYERNIPENYRVKVDDYYKEITNSGI